MKGFNNQKTMAVFDPMLLQREYHNRNKFAVEFTIDARWIPYVIRSKGIEKRGPDKAVVEPDEFLYLPHGYYIIKGVGVPDGEPVNMLINLEKNMFKGNKKASDRFGF